MAFESQTQVVIHTVVTHPPGTTFDAEGKPIPPEDTTDDTSAADAKDN